MREKFELADVINRFGAEFIKARKINPMQAKVLGKISQCRTAALGGHEEACSGCGVVRYSYNSCGNRHCPKCRAAKQAFRIDGLMQNTLPVKHYHIIFTVPHVLDKTGLFIERDFYSLLFAAVWFTLRSFGYTHFGVESGAVCVPRTRGQNPGFHLHIHCIVPAAGYSLKGEWINIGQADGKFLYPVHRLSKLFKEKFLDSLKRCLRKPGRLSQFNDLVQQAYAKKWVVNCEPSLANADHVVKYLGQYTHRVAITNQRILNIEKGKVTFIAKDYRDNATKKPVTLSGVEFLRRFCMHILPQHFVKIRRYGIYNHTVKRNLLLQFVPEQKPGIDSVIKKSEPPGTSLERFKRLTGVDVCLCPVCKKGRMVRISGLPKIRSPDLFSKYAHVLNIQ